MKTRTLQYCTCTIDAYSGARPCTRCHWNVLDNLQQYVPVRTSTSVRISLPVGMYIWYQLAPSRYTYMYATIVRYRRVLVLQQCIAHASTSRNGPRGIRLLLQHNLYYPYQYMCQHKHVLLVLVPQQGSYSRTQYSCSVLTLVKLHVHVAIAQIQRTPVGSYTTL